MAKRIPLVIEYEIGDQVWIKTDPDQFPHIVTGYVVLPGMIKYIINVAHEESNHFDFELSPTASIGLSHN